MDNKFELILSKSDKDLLLEVLFAQKYASEVISCEISDVESGQKKADAERMKKLQELFDKLQDSKL
jgi:hypothetical protein